LKTYLCDPSGMGLSTKNVQDFFDDPRAPADILKEAGSFLINRQRDLEANGRLASDLLFYFVGHAGFVAPDDAYCLFVRFTQESLQRTTSLHITDLAEVCREHARHLRRYFILDACFAGAAPRFIYQSSRGAIIERELTQVFPRKGVALLCSSSGQHPSKAPKGEPYTMFTGAMLNVLTRSQPAEEARLSLRVLGRLTTNLIRDKYEDAAVRPEVHSPDQRDGDLADVPLFPNISAPGLLPMPTQPLKTRHVLHQYPLSPLVPSHKVSRRIKQMYADLIPVREARQWIDTANSFRQDADPEDSTITLIRQSHLRSPVDNAPIDFWIDAFGEAGRHGPRMLAALLLVLDDAQFDEHAKQDRRRLLEFLRNPKVDGSRD
jgi:hypothetical protein